MTGHLDPAGMDPAELEALGLGTAALRYQQMGYRVLALGAGSKRPHSLFVHGVHWATTDPAMVTWMWPQDRLAGVGVATGAGSQLVVIDLDVKGGQDGLMIWRSFLAVNNLHLPPGPWASTPSGGEHIWLRLPPGVVVGSRRGILPGVDIKAEGGYVAAAPSRAWVDGADRPGQPGDGGRVLLPYRMHGCPCQLPAAPAWLLQWIEQAPASGEGGSGSGEGELPGLAELARTGLPVGGRNVMVHRLACSLYRRCGTGPDGEAAVRDAVGQVLAATQMAGFGQAELNRTLASARSFVAGQEEQERAAWQAR